MRSFGENAGMAFQIKDDLFDYSRENVGKPTGNDIKEKKLTLPLIYTLNNIDKDSRRKIIFIIKNENKNKEKVQFVIDKVIESGGIQYAQKKMDEFKQKSIDILQQFPNNVYRKGLEDLVNFVTDRKY
jgi:octaprenyl-diphosphate synthase